MSKDVDIWEQPHECRAEDGRQPGIRVVSKDGQKMEIVLPCVAPGFCPWRPRSRSETEGLDSSTRS